MEIEKAKEEIAKLEVAINNLIGNFEKQTGLPVEGIDLRTINHVGGGKVIGTQHIVNVRVLLSPHL